MPSITNYLAFLQVPVFKEPNFTIPGIPGIVQHEILNNRRHVLTKVNIIVSFVLLVLLLKCLSFAVVVL